MKGFLLKLILFTVCCACGLFCWNTFSPALFHDSVSWLILLFFAIVTGLVHAYLVRASEGDAKAFVGKFMGLTGLKLLVYLLFLIIVLLTNRDHARMIALYFLVMYLLFTVFEVSSLYRKLKK